MKDRRWPAVAVSFSLLLPAGCGGGGGQSDAAAKQQITTTWTSFFLRGAGTAGQLQDGNTLQQALKQNEANPVAKQTAAKVKDIALLKKADCDANGLPFPCAQVTYDVLVNGSAALPNSKGYAVRQNKQWKVSKATFCGLVALGNGGKPPADCA